MTSLNDLWWPSLILPALGIWLRQLCLVSSMLERRVGSTVLYCSACKAKISKKASLSKQAMQENCWRTGNQISIYVGQCFTMFSLILFNYILETEIARIVLVTFLVRKVKLLSSVPPAHSATDPWPAGLGIDSTPPRPSGVTAFYSLTMSRTIHTTYVNSQDMRVHAYISS